MSRQQSRSQISARSKNLAAVELGKLGGRAGGQARAAKLSREQRVRIARQAAAKRWGVSRVEVEQQRNRSGSRPHRSELENRIVAVATRMFAERGFNALAMRDVAREAKVGLPTIYMFFRDKRDLYVRCSIALAERYGRNQLDLMHQVPRGPERIYAFAYLHCRIQADPAFPKLIHRHLLEEDAQILQPLAEGILRQQFTELRNSVALIVGEEKAEFVTLFVYASLFGLVRLSPVSEFVQKPLLPSNDPALIAQGALSLIFPGVKWDGIARDLDVRLEEHLLASGCARP